MLTRFVKDALVMLLYFFVAMPSDSCATNCKPLSHMNGLLNTTCMLIQSINNIPASKYAQMLLGNAKLAKVCHTLEKYLLRVPTHCSGRGARKYLLATTSVSFAEIALRLCFSEDCRTMSG